MDASFNGNGHSPGTVIDDPAHMGHGHHDLHDKSLGEILSSFTQDATTLIRQEVELAKAEMTEKGKEVGVGAGMFVAAEHFLIIGLGFLGLTIAAGISSLFDTSLWVGSFVVMVIFFAVAGVLAYMGKERIAKASPPVPEQTIETIKETKEEVFS